MSVRVIHGDCLDMLAGMDAGSVDALPPGLTVPWQFAIVPDHGQTRP